MKTIKIMGVDPSSSRSGVVILKNNSPSFIGFWEKDKKKSTAENLWSFALFLQRVKAKQKIDIVAVEEISHSRNVNTIRKIAYFEGVALQKAGEWGAISMSIKVQTARKLALGNGNFTKEWCYNKMSRKFNLAPFDLGGSDESDALVMAFAGLKNVSH